MSFHVPNNWRIRKGEFGSHDGEGNNGAFLIRKSNMWIKAIASDGLGWEHVSITIGESGRTPTWEEMCFIKGMFWDEEDCVMQLHPAKSEYVNCHPNCLHLWRPTNTPIPVPPLRCV